MYNIFRVDRIGKSGLTEHEIPVLLDTGERVRAYAAVDNRVYPPLPLLTGLFLIIVIKSRSNENSELNAM